MTTLGMVGDVVTTDVIILGGVLWLAFIIVWLDWFATKERRELLRELRKGKDEK